MPFGALLCAGCGRVQAVDLGHGSGRCSGCGKAQSLAKATILHRCDGADEIQRVVMALAAQRSGMSADEIARLLAEAEPTRKPDLGELLGELSAHGEFTEEDFSEAARRIGVAGKARNLWNAAVAGNLFLEVRPGRFRVLSADLLP